MGCVWSPVFIDSVVCIAMIGSQKDYITVSDCSGDYFLNAFVDASNCLANGIIDTCVPYHISIREVQDDHIFLLSIDGFYKFFSNFWCAHFRLKVVSGYLWRIYQNPVFILEWGFTTAIEEEGHVSIFFRLCYPELTFSCIRNSLSQCLFHYFLVEKNVETFEVGLIRSKAAIIQWKCLHSEVRHILLCEDNGDFPCTVVAEIEEYYCISFLYLGNRLAFGICDDDRFDEFVCDFCLVRGLDAFNSGCELIPFAFYQHVVSQLYTIPSLIPVHSIETTADGSNFTSGLGHMLFQVCYETFAAARVGVTTVHKAMYVDILQTVFFGLCQKFIKMIK